MWLPPTIKKFSSVHSMLLEKCQINTEGILAKVSIIRIARSYGYMKTSELFQNSISCSHDVTNPNSDLHEYLKKILHHLDEDIRAEVLASICTTQKISEPVTFEESNLLKEFFTWNMNIDSAAFRQRIIRSFKALIIRLRDSCSNEIKKNSSRFDKSESLSYQNMYKSSDILKVNASLILWFLHHLHKNLAPDGNYQRRILSLALYQELLLAFYNKEKDSIIVVQERYKPVVMVIEHISQSVPYEDSVTESSVGVIKNLLFSWTYDLLLTTTLDEMNDIRGKAEDVITLLTKADVIEKNECSEWFVRGLNLCKSAKMSASESGAAVILMIASSCCKNPKSVLPMTSKSSSISDIIDFLLDEVKQQFDDSKQNLLKAATKAPIHGTLLALGRCFTETSTKSGLEKSYVINTMLPQITTLLIELTEFVLGKLSCASPNGSKVAPSFAEMGESIDQIVNECRISSNYKIMNDVSQSNNDDNEDLDDDDDNNNDEFTLASHDHQLVLACSWQILRVCCRIVNSIIKSWANDIPEEFLKNLITCVIVRVLTGTRHKGAIEAARAAYSQVCAKLLNSSSANIVYQQVESVLNLLEEGVNTSITRRSAGLSMMIQGALGAAPGSTTKLLHDVIKRLLTISQFKVEDKEITDCSPVQALHILRALVLYAGLSHYMVQYLPKIMSICLSSFSSPSWSYRNAALQLYGAVVPRMVGQKKVKDDSSILNCITAPEFLSRHVSLSSHLYNLLEISLDKLSCNKKSSGFCNFDGNQSLNMLDKVDLTYSSEVVSTVIPILSFLARLSPGTSLQQTDVLKRQLSQFCQLVENLLGSPMMTIRRLSGQALLSLTLPSEVINLISKLLTIFEKNYHFSNNNVINGHLIAIKIFIKNYYETLDDEIIERIIISISWMLTSEFACFENKNLVFEILMMIKDNDFINSKIEMSRKVNQPGMSKYTEITTSLKLNSSFTSVVELFFEENLFNNNQDISNACFQYICSKIDLDEHSPEVDKFVEIVWNRLNNSIIDQSIHYIDYLLILEKILEKKTRFSFQPSEICIQNLTMFHNEFQGMKTASVVMTIVSHLIRLCKKNPFDIQFLEIWSALILKYSSPNLNEDYRLSSSKCLVNSFDKILESSFKSIEEHTISACFYLLQDEDEIIRNKTSHAVHLLVSSNDKQVHHPSISLKLLADHLVSSGKINYVFILWKLSQGKLLHLEKLEKSLLFKNSSNKLFVSHSVNLYQEPRYLSSLLSDAFISNKSILENNQEILKEFLLQQSNLMNKEGEHLSSLIDNEFSSLVTNKRLLMFFLKYMISCFILEKISKIINVPIKLKYKFLFNNDFKQIVARLNI